MLRGEKRRERIVREDEFTHYFSCASPLLAEVATALNNTGLRPEREVFDDFLAVFEVDVGAEVEFAGHYLNHGGHTGRGGGDSARWTVLQSSRLLKN